MHTWIGRPAEAQAVLKFAAEEIIQSPTRQSSKAQVRGMSVMVFKLKQSIDNHDSGYLRMAVQLYV